ncbi:hypothetical protein HJC23_012885 [Cyclotella cryptica]|uniref:Palmitoyltransferase n=1 Tax=Cyclotella cryptica TaxID=29204 RepID=A0ABD3Q1T3_9STRA
MPIANRRALSSPDNKMINVTASIPAASALERGHVDRNEEMTNNSDDNFDPDEIFEDIIETQTRETISDSDLDRLLGPLPRRNNHEHRSALEQEDFDDSRERRLHGSKGPGNMIVVCPRCVHPGFGIMGPHWFGPICCLGILTLATIYHAPRAYANVGPISAMICIIFYIAATIALTIVSCSDPGIVKRDACCLPTDISAARGWRYCDLCSLYQPPGAVHCQDCNVCIEGYDHHCPWMGTCIGKKNFTSFMVFNLTWLFYLFYVFGWVVCFGPIVGG